ncbi:hypothetical protein Y1Q_0008021 [Alligator mississippiensis]|uniref:Uncharacterized protein n=1 Tax=Alligator mississippiensis TaxID=8496 RepID=A0A151NFC1_ALLMI|nr:hypothetical protein Y1Q_0008021 [Alligator mississippiensis]
MHSGSLSWIIEDFRMQDCVKMANQPFLVTHMKSADWLKCLQRNTSQVTGTLSGSTDSKVSTEDLDGHHLSLSHFKSSQVSPKAAATVGAPYML